jgi:hypothetical protein
MVLTLQSDPATSARRCEGAVFNAHIHADRFSTEQKRGLADALNYIRELTEAEASSPRATPS